MQPEEVAASLAELPADRLEEWRTVLRDKGFCLIGKLDCEPKRTGKKGYYEYSGTGTLRGAFPHILASPRRLEKVDARVGGPLRRAA